MMPCSYLSTNYSLALSHLLSFFLPHQTPTPLLKQPIIPESKVSNVPLRGSFWTLWNLKFPLKNSLFSWEENRGKLLSTKMSRVALGYVFDIHGEKRMSFSRFCPLLSTMITVRLSYRKEEDDFTGAPGALPGRTALAALTDPMCCHRASGCI